MARITVDKLRVTFIRAGLTKGGESGQYIGVSNEPLLEWEKTRLHQRRELGIYPKVSRVYTSPMVRCMETSYIIYKEVPAIAAEGFLPFDFGVLEGKRREDYSKEYQRGEPESAGGVFSIPEAEPPYLFIARVKKAFENLLLEVRPLPLRDVAVVSHESVITTIVREYLIPRPIQRVINLDHGGGITLEYDYNVKVATLSTYF